MVEKKQHVGSASTNTAVSGVRNTEQLGSAPGAPPPPIELAIEGTHGDYDVGPEIARGGMGRIVEAYDRRHDRPVALKLLLRKDAIAEKRFVREAWITGRLQHPAIVPLYEAGRWETGEPFFAMKLVRGASLADVLRTKTTHEERLALLPHLIALTEALAYAHGEGVVHRDLKPSNVLVGAFGETVVIDWGLAKRIADPEDDEVAARAGVPDPEPAASLTAEGHIVGTPSYMPPEQARGERVDARADVYALGACLYHALSGVPPYGGTTGGRVAIAELLAKAPPTLASLAPETPADLAAIVTKAMAREPAERYATAKEMAEDLRRFATGRLVSAHAYTAGELVKRWVARRKAILAVAVVAVAVLAVGGGVGVRRITRERDTARVARADAEAQRANAVVRRDAAEKLIDSLVGDFRQKLVPIGRLDVMSSLGESVLDYYRNVPIGDDVDAATLGRRAKAIGTLAGVADVRRDAEPAIHEYQDAIALCDQALAKDPTLGEVKASRAWFLYRIGCCEDSRYQADASLESLKKSLSAFDEAEAAIRDPAALKDAQNRHRLVFASFGEVLFERGDLDEAERILTRQIELDRDEQSRKPGEVPDWAMRYRAYERISRGSLEGARSDAESSLHARMAWSAARPDDAYAAVGVLEALELAMYVDGEQGAYDSMLEKNRRIVSGYDERIRDDSTQLNWLDEHTLTEGVHCEVAGLLGAFKEGKGVCALVDATERKAMQRSPGQHSACFLSATRDAVAAMSLAQGDARSALSEYERNADLLSRPAGLTHDRHHDDGLVDAVAGIARSELALVDLDAALRQADELYGLVQTYVEQSPHNVLRLDRATTAELLLGDIHLARHEGVEAREAYAHAHDGCGPLLERAADYARMKLHCAEADAKLAAQTEDPAEAKRLRTAASELVAKLDHRLVKTAARDLPGVVP